MVVPSGWSPEALTKPLETFPGMRNNAWLHAWLGPKGQDDALHGDEMAGMVSWLVAQQL